MNTQRHRHGDLIVPLIILAGATILFRVSDLDIAVERLFFDAGAGWHYGGRQPWRWLYDHGPVPALTASYAAFGVVILSFFCRRLKPCRVAALFLVVVMLVGPGLIVNTVLKQNWGRPRPLDLVQFAGEKEFLPVWVKGDAAGGQSFPSGHASMGFYWLAPFFILRRNYPAWARFFLLFGIGFGLLMGLTRMVQGSHFPSDILWSFGCVYLAAWLLGRVLRPDLPRPL